MVAYHLQVPTKYTTNFLVWGILASSTLLLQITLGGTVKTLEATVLSLILS